MDKLLFIRVDGGKDDGLGHIKRCISISNIIEKNKNFIEPIFLINKNNKTSKEILKNNNKLFFEVNGKVNSRNELIDLKKLLNFDKNKIILLDSKRISKNYVNYLKKFARVVLFEDEKSFNSSSDLVINNNIWANNFYKNKKNKLLGLKFNTIPKSFFKKNSFDNNSNKILISLGGEDPDNLTLKILSLIYKSISNLKFIIILGHSYPNKSLVKDFCNKENINTQIINSPEDISLHLTKLRLVISAGGLSCYEFAAAGLPQLIVVLAKHQNLLAKSMQSYNCAKILTNSNKLFQNKIIKDFTNFYNNKKNLMKMSNNAKKLIKKSGCDLITYNLLKV